VSLRLWQASIFRDGKGKFSQEKDFWSWGFLYCPNINGQIKKHSGKWQEKTVIFTLLQ
jgi:hypothetical protein